MKRVMVRYRVKPEHVDENERLVRAVYDELAAREPDGLRYATFKLDDGVTFVHLAFHDDPNPLAGVAAFAEFQRGIRDRCDELPTVTEAEQIGSYRL
jgi:hypothetical protein